MRFHLIFLFFLHYIFHYIFHLIHKFLEAFPQTRKYNGTYVYLFQLHIPEVLTGWQVR